MHSRKQEVAASRAIYDLKPSRYLAFALTYLRWKGRIREGRSVAYECCCHGLMY